MDWWAGYTVYKRSQLKPSTRATTFRHVKRVIEEQLPTTDPMDAVVI
ncbi:MAG: hypothetical protein HC781_15105 [Leptolyngbyaceae cyanobacterium CSU_1_4]|nr:hypothetical protein [Leptolyngbyaceae cyanobacterium CSU_1_4]